MKNSKLLDFLKSEEQTTAKYSGREEYDTEEFKLVAPARPKNESKRLDEFLGNYNFYSNSIALRIQSSKAIEQFKNVQSFQLNQIANGKFHFKKDRKEILLLKYDMWTRWFYEVENYLIEMSSEYPDLVLEQTHVDFIIDLCNKTSNVYKKIIDENDRYFDKDFCGVWLSGHELSYELMLMRINRLVGYKFDVGFAMLGQIIIEIMQYTLIEIHELNGLYQHFHEDNELCEMPFLVFTNLDKVCKKFTDKHLIIRRLKIYKKYFNITELYIKNYSDDQFNHAIFDKIEELGISINYRMNF